MLVVTHEMGFARKAGDRVLFMADGQVVEDTTPEEFFTHPSRIGPRTSSARSSLTDHQSPSDSPVLVPQDNLLDCTVHLAAPFISTAPFVCRQLRGSS